MRPLYFCLRKRSRSISSSLRGRVVRVAAFGGIGNVDAAVPDQQAFAQPGSGGDQGAVADLAGVALAQRVDLVGLSSATP